MAKKTERQKIIDTLIREQRIQQVLDVLKNPIVSMIGGVSAVNFIYNNVKNKEGGPLLFSNEARALMQTACIAYPLFAQDKGDVKWKMGLVTAGGLATLLASALGPAASTVAEGAEVYGDLTMDRAEKGATFLPGPGITYMP